MVPQTSLLLALDFPYSTDRAVVVVEGATHATFVTGVSTMLALGIVLNIIEILCPVPLKAYAFQGFGTIAQRPPSAGS